MPTYSQKVWGRDPAYGEVFYARATGKAPEMESSKATAKQLKGILVPKARVLDVGCGAGHYLRSLRRAYPFDFSYDGADVTPNYIRLAKKAYANDPLAHFRVAPVEKLPYAAKTFDIVMCCNVLLHLPAVVKPLQELWRVTKGTLLVRTLIGGSSFRIKQVHEQGTPKGKTDPVFDAKGEPKGFHYYNIYSEQYMRWLAGTLPGAAKITIEEDRDFDPKAMGTNRWPDKNKPADLTEIFNGWQVNNYVLQPWCFLRVTRTGRGA
ncbi:MAG: class I SAM-dependent methyltransferase [Candidatus Peribacteraceae bacterium]|nr:class I SAM-dependent methyltransferase [Candidatus Peribacteraceae bacterium]